MIRTKPCIRNVFYGLCVLSALFVNSSLLAAETNREPAELKVRGYGFFGNRELKGFLTLLPTSEVRPQFFEANYVEDAVLILFSRLRRDGYLFPRIRVIAEFRDGGRQEFTWDDPLGEPLPRPFEARRLE